VATGKFDGEISFLIQALYPLISGACVKGREIYPVPLSVRRNEQRNASEADTEQLRRWLVENTGVACQDRFGTNYLLIDAALELHFNRKIPHLALKAIGVEPQKGVARDALKTTTLFRTHKWAGHDAAGGSAKSLRLTDAAIALLFFRKPSVQGFEDGRKYEPKPR